MTNLKEQSAHTANIWGGQNPRIYTAGNISSDGRLNDPLQDNSILWWKWKATDSNVYDYRSDLLPSEYFVNTPYQQVGEPMPIKTAVETKTYVVANVGANASLNADGTVTRYTDMQDTRYLSVVGGTWDHPFYPYTMYDRVRTWWEWDTEEIRFELNRKYSAYMVANGISDVSEMMDETLMYDDFVAYVNSQGATPINTRPDNFYISNPHIPEIWLVANDYVGKSHNYKPAGDDSYTILEMYLNGVDVATKKD